MLERLLVWERDAFFMLNGSDSPFLDHFMWIFSGKTVWLPLAVFVVVVLFYKRDWRDSLLVLLAIVLTVTICDQFASHFCKPFFARMRPTYHPDFMDQVKVLFDYHGGKYGFISSHAANAFGFATFMALLLRDRFFSWTIFAWAILVSYSRIYLGVHFITDIIPGVLCGLLFGYLVYRLYEYARLRLFSGGSSLELASFPSKRRAWVISYAIWITILLIAIFNVPLASCLG